MAVNQERTRYGSDFIWSLLTMNDDGITHMQSYFQSVPKPTRVYRGNKTEYYTAIRIKPTLWVKL